MSRRLTRNLEEINSEIQGWKDSVTLRTAVYQQARLDLKDAEHKYKLAKKTKNRTYSELQKARKELNKWKKRKAWIPSSTRRWAKENIGEVFNKMQENAREF